MILGWGEFGAWLGIVIGELVANNITMEWANLYIKSLIRSKE